MAKKIKAKLVEFDPKAYNRYMKAAFVSDAPSFAEWIRQACEEKLQREAAELARERAMEVTK